jgi:hypothetical protein
MRAKEFCDGCGHVISDGVKPWTLDADEHSLYVVHPNERCYAAIRRKARITHGRHCICGACAREDWTDPRLACCGMHGPSCPAAYHPLGRAGDPVGADDHRTPSRGQNEA